MIEIKQIAVLLLVKLVITRPIIITFVAAGTFNILQTSIGDAVLPSVPRLLLVQNIEIHVVILVAIPITFVAVVSTNFPYIFDHSVHT